MNEEMSAHRVEVSFARSHSWQEAEADFDAWKDWVQNPTFRRGENPKQQ